MTISLQAPLVPSPFVYPLGRSGSITSAEVSIAFALFCSVLLCSWRILLLIEHT